MRRLNIFDGQVKVGVASRSPCWSTPSRSHRTPQTPQPDDNALTSSSASARPALPPATAAPLASRVHRPAFGQRQHRVVRAQCAARATRVLALSCRSRLLPAIFVARVADTDASSVEPAIDRGGAIPDSDWIVGVPCVPTHSTGEMGPVAGTRLGDERLQFSRLHVCWPPFVLLLHPMPRLPSAARESAAFDEPIAVRSRARRDRDHQQRQDAP
jgi:hypothetical protein